MEMLLDSTGQIDVLPMDHTTNPHKSEDWIDLIVSDPPTIVKADVCIIGAGVAGCALAWCLGRRGIKVVVVERDFLEPDKFIGELLQPGGVQTLRAIGMGEVLEGLDAQPVSGYALFNKDKHFGIRYPEVEGKVAEGYGFRYGKFVMSLRKKMAQLPSVTLIHGAVKQLSSPMDSDNVHGVLYQTADGANAEVEASLSVLCDGAFSRIRTQLASTNTRIKGFMVGLLLKDCKLPYEGHGHVFLTNESPCLAYPVSSSEVRILIDFPGEQSPKATGKLDARLDEVGRALPEEMQASYKRAIENLKVKAMPNQILSAGPSHSNGVVILGDALNMRHPLTGGGMTVALSDVQLLDDLLSTEVDFSDLKGVGQIVESFYNKRHRSDASINILADALYDVLKYPYLKEACFDYLSQGPGYTAGPIAILSAVSRDRDMLLRKFSAVAIYASKKRLRPFRGFRSVAESFNILHEATQIIRPLIKNERPSRLMRVALAFSNIVFPNKTRPAE